MLNELDLLTSTCARLSKTRVIALNKKSRDESLQFELIGENNRPSAVFVNNVEESSKAHEAGLGRGDQVRHLIKIVILLFILFIFHVF